MRRTILILCLFLLFASYANAQTTAVPPLMNFQGRLARPDGTPLPDGTYSVTFKLYTVATGGTFVFSHTLPAVVLRNGVFNVLLGGPLGTISGPLNSSLFAGNLWLEIQIGTETPLTPRQQLVTSAYAMKANSIRDNGVTSASILDNAITSADIMNGTIQGIDILNGTITADKLAPGLLPPNAWLLGGNIITDSTTQWLGIKNNLPLNIHVNSQRAYQIAYDSNTINQDTWTGINLIGGFWLNRVAQKVVGATIGGGLQINNTGYNNVVYDIAGTVGGGFDNLVGDDNSDVTNARAGVIAGGESNRALAKYATIAGGANNVVSAESGAILGGRRNTANRYVAVVGGGESNTAGGERATIGGGLSNNALSDSATIGGGYANTASNIRATVAGGEGNMASGPYAFIGGGWQNQALGFSTSIGGGRENTADGNYTTLGGGYNNKASGPYATVAGGARNIASGSNATVGGGLSNIAAGLTSFAAGRRAQANHNGAFVWGDSTDADFFSTGNNQFLIRANGGVGINKNNPASALDVAGSIFMMGFRLTPGANTGYVLTADASGNGTWQQLPPFTIPDGSITTPKLADNAVNSSKLASQAASLVKVSGGAMSNNDGNIGIGTPAPGSLLDVAGNADSAAQVGVMRVSRASQVQKYVYFGYDSGDYGYLQSIFVGDSWKNFILNPHGGNVGVGTTTPNVKFTVNGGGLGTTAGNALDIAAHSASVGTNQVGLVSRLVRTANGNNWESASLVLQRVTDVTPQAVLAFYGSNIGIGTLTPGKTLEVHGDVRISGPLGNENRLTVGYDGGKVGINTATPQSALDVMGNIRCTDLIETSDLRYKQNIAAITDPLDAILNMRGVSFDWKREDFRQMDFAEGRQIGFIAQEVEKILPQLVHTDNKGYKSVSYAKVVPVLVEAMKEQQKQIQQITAQKDAEIATLNRQMEALAEAVRLLQEQRR